MDTPPPMPQQTSSDVFETNSSDRILAALCHASPLFGLPLILPLIVFLVKKDEPGFVRRQSVEALNFHITTFLASILASILIFVLIGFVLLWCIGIAVVILAIIAIIKTIEGKTYSYPVNLRLVK